MYGNHAVCAAALLVMILAGSAPGDYFFDVWPASADGSMDCHPTEGYAIAGIGNYRFTKSYHHFSFMDFAGPSDGPDRIPQYGPGDSRDGKSLADWLADKKAFAASLYLRTAGSEDCDPTAGPGAYLNDPVTIIGFRGGNVGRFVDYGPAGPGYGPNGCCAGYANALLAGGESAPVAWRMGSAPYLYKGDKGQGGEYWKLSMRDSLEPGQEVVAGQMTGSSFAGDGFGGFSEQANRFAFGWIVERSDAHLLNSGTLGSADCTGGDEPRDLGGDGTSVGGWFARHIDRRVVTALAGDPELKGLVFHSIGAPTYQNTAIHGREFGNSYAPYLAITATWKSDVDEDGCVDVADLLTLAPTFGVGPSDPAFDARADLDDDGAVDVIDMLYLAWQFGRVPPLN